MSENTSAALPLKVKIRAYVTSTPFWKGRGKRSNRICYLSGVKNTYADENSPFPKIAFIDASIVDVIKFMNEAGIDTAYCCSGRPCDHRRASFKDLPPWRRAYVMAMDPLPASYVAMLPDGVVLDGPCTIRFSECSPRELANRWHKLKCRTLRWWGIQQGY